MFKRKTLAFANGERYATIVDENGVPDFWVTLFVTVNLRPELTQTAMLNTLQDIMHFKLWEVLNQRDVLAEFARGQFLTDLDVINLRDHCACEARSVQRWLKSSQKKKNVIKFNRSKAIKSGQFRRVSKAHQANRLTHIASYLAFAANSMLRKRANYTEMKVLAAAMESGILKQRPKVTGKSGNNEPDVKAPPPEVFESLLKTVRVDSENNPYRDVSVRHRNALMFDVLSITGMRAGEVLSLRVGDVKFDEGDSIVSVHRRHDDPLDPRPLQPVAKTLPRSIPIPSSLARELRHYIMEIRARTHGAGRHPFIFVTHHPGKAYQGNPISDSSFRNRVLGPAVKGNSELFEDITRHGFRHTFNYRLSKLIDAHNELSKSDPDVTPISERCEIQIRKSLNGWKSDSTGETYNIRHIKEIANELLKKDAQEQAKHLQKG